MGSATYEQHDRDGYTTGLAVVEDTTGPPGVIDLSAGPDAVRLSGMLNLRRLTGRYLLSVRQVGDGRVVYQVARVEQDGTVRDVRTHGLHDLFELLETTSPGEPAGDREVAIIDHRD